MSQPNSTSDRATTNPVLALDVTPLWGRKTTGIQRVMRAITPYLAKAAAQRNWDVALVRHVAEGLEELTRWSGSFDPFRVTRDLDHVTAGQIMTDDSSLGGLTQFLRRTSRALRRTTIAPVGYRSLARNVRGMVPTTWRRKVRGWFKKPRPLCTTADAYLSFAAGVLPANPPLNMPLERAVFVLHDLIPLHHSEFCSPELVQAFANNLSHLTFNRALTRGQIVTASRHIAADIREFFHTLARQTVDVHLANWGYDGETFFPQPNPAFRQQLGIPNDALLVAAVSTQDPRKRFAEIQAAVNHRQAYAVFVGQGEPRREGNVIYLGHASDEMVRQAYSNSDVVVNWSAAEGFGLSTIEALACGARVVIPPDNPVSLEVGGKHVVVAPTADVAGLCAALETAVQQPRPCPDLTLFTWAKSASVFEDLLWPNVAALRKVA